MEGTHLRGRQLRIKSNLERIWLLQATLRKTYHWYYVCSTCCATTALSVYEIFDCVGYAGNSWKVRYCTKQIFLLYNYSEYFWKIFRLIDYNLIIFLKFGFTWFRAVVFGNFSFKLTACIDLGPCKSLLDDSSTHAMSMKYINGPKEIFRKNC